MAWLLREALVALLPDRPSCRSIKPATRGGEGFINTVSKEMLINVSEGEECRIALLEDGRLEELYMERASSTSHVGNIYKGKVTNVEAAIQAAFVDFGLGRNGFLHISDLLPSYFGKRGEDMQESVGRKLGRRDRPPIQRCLRRGDEITVQIIKEGIGTKGPTLSTYLSIPGRILVMMPGMENFGVSRKIEDDSERRRLRKILDELDPVDGVGFIVRTAGLGKTKLEIEKDLKYLTRLWETITKLSKTSKSPVELYTEGDLVTRTVRDVYGADVEKIVIDSKDVAKRVKDFLKLTAPRGKTKIELYKDPIPLFHVSNIEREIELIHSRVVPLPSGGSLVIDSTEAIVAIDVNSGKFRDHSDAETTAFKTDMEAADEIPRQLKLRDLGGVIICDFIDLRFERHRRQLEQRLFDNFKRDRAKTRILRMSEFGIIEITRQRMRPSLKRSIYSDCPHCRGHGLIKTPESMALDVMRKLAIAVNDDRVARAELHVASEVAFFLANHRRTALSALETETGKEILIAQQEGIALDEIKFDLFDARDGRVYLDVLGMVPDKSDRGRLGGERDRGGYGGGQGGGDRGGHRIPPRHRPEPVKALQDFDEEEEDDELEDSAAPAQVRRDEGGRDGGGRDGGGRDGGARDVRDGGGRDVRDRDGRGREDRPREVGARDGRGRDDRGRGDRGRNGRGRDDRGRDDRGRDDQGRDDRNRQQPQVNRAPVAPRPADQVRPINLEQQKAGDGYRGPKVVEGDGAEAQGPAMLDEFGNPLPPQEGDADGAPRRRRRRRGGRGRRRNRDGSFDPNNPNARQDAGGQSGELSGEFESPEPGGEGAEGFDNFEAPETYGADDNRSARKPGSPSDMRTPLDEFASPDLSDAEFESPDGDDERSMGRAPSAIGDDESFDGPVYAGPTEVTDNPLDIGSAPQAVVDEASDEIEIVERPKSRGSKAGAGEDAAKGKKGKRATKKPKATKSRKADVIADVADVIAEEAEPELAERAIDEDDAAPARGRRGKRGGRGSRSSVAPAASAGASAVAAVRGEIAFKRIPPAAVVVTPKPVPSRPAAAAPKAVVPEPKRSPIIVAPASPIKITRSGSTDKHLVKGDEPGGAEAHETSDTPPAKEIRSKSDLDELPEGEE
jgi:ribonuclease E